jgi:protein TonB
MYTNVMPVIRGQKTVGRQGAVERYGGLAAAVLLHLVAIWGVLQFEGVRRSIIEAAPIMVNFITPPPEVHEPPPPKPVTKRPEPLLTPPVSAPILATKTIDSPSPLAPPEPISAPLPPIEALPAKPTAVVPPSFGAAYLQNPPPEYPTASRRLHEEGKVLLRVFVSAAGAADRVEIERSSGSARLDSAAQQAVRAWRFVPARQGDQTVPAWVIVPIQFSLEG